MTVIASPTPTPLTILITSKLEPDDPPSSQRASYLQQPPKAKAVEGEDVVFPCFLQSDVDEVQAVEKVRWYVQSLEGRKNVLQGNKTVEEEFAGRVFLSGMIEESVGTIIGIAVAVVGVAAGLAAVILTQFKDKLNCLQK
ncbi:hypothetical protein cypCar_00013445 [Cyprinus carpio]|nr:hypothetical protein cypCar_00013445 [Cyprinus carpio]